MNTPTHFLMTAALRKAAPDAGIVTSAFLIGSVAPDIPLYLLSLGGLAYFCLFLGWTSGKAAQHMYDTLYFSDPWWIGFHNLFHTPVVLGLLVLVARVAQGRLPRTAAWVTWFAYAALIHFVVDVFTHTGDGPLLLWPIEWTLRFDSPISYWDPRYYGRQFFVFEVIFDTLLLAYLLGPWARRKLARTVGSDGPKPADGP